MMGFVKEMPKVVSDFSRKSSKIHSKVSFRSIFISDESRMDQFHMDKNGIFIISMDLF